MESCHHLSNIRPKGNSSILNPQKWMCYICGTTESVWSCLSCPNVACGRFNEEHALKHFSESKHALCIEVNSKYVYCYLCDDYVMNDNSSGDLKLIRSALSAIATQSFNDVETRGRTLLRSYSHTAVTSTYTSKEDDKIATADWHWRQKLVGKIFSAWHACMLEARNEKTPKKQGKQTSKVTPPSTSPYLRKRTLIPGITGLRNLGNTCYMNSILQILSNLECFRDYFIKKLETTTTVNSNSQVATQSSSKLKSTNPELLSTPVTSSGQGLRTRSKMSQSPMTTPHLSRQTTVECFQHLMTPSKSRSSRKGEGLSGGSSTDLTPIRRQLICNVESRDQPGEKISLCQELNGLFRVLWSGRWAQVSPHALLQAVWQAIPAFKGYAQHDAQEFLCELLDKVQAELGSSNTGPSTDISTDTFQGWLASQVTCLKCGNVSETKESFMDLSLEFPERYQITKQNSSVAQEMCHVTEMLAKFTDTEKLEGKIYACEKCNEARKNKTTKIYTEAQKRILIRTLPATLRLHLKRFRWSGRLHREKISTHVAFDEVMDISPFCDLNHLDPKGYEYKLQGVVMHHGKGFGCGHYTAKCWNLEGESWIDCNDARMTLCQLQDVLQSQAYILFYTKVPKTDGDSQSLTDCSQSTEDYNMQEDSPPPLKRFDSSQIIDGEITFNFRTPPVLTRMQQRKRSNDSSSDVTAPIIKRRRSTLW